MGDRNDGIVKVVVNIDRNVQGQYRAVCPGLPGCCAYGDSRTESITKIDTVIRGYLASLDRPDPENLNKVISEPRHTACSADATAEQGKRDRQ